jgi:hypothetical protein
MRVSTVFSVVSVSLVIALTLVAEAAAQTAPPAAGQEKRVQGEVRAINPSGTEITLTDGTKLVAPPGTALRPGALTEGMTVVAIYTEQNGENVLTDLAVREPSASPPSGPQTPPPSSDSPKPKN